LVRLPRPDAKQAGKQLALIRPTEADSPYVHRAKAWVALQSGQRARALEELGRALEDPLRQAPELRAELKQTRDGFEAEAGR
jgi:Tfp pilus assembly protein PilF